jgi:hypothetical protein
MHSILNGTTPSARVQPLIAAVKLAGVLSVVEPTYADAIMDRLVNNAHRIDLSGESLRRTKPMQGKKP